MTTPIESAELESALQRRRAEIEDALAHVDSVVGDRRDYSTADAIRWTYRHRVELAPLGAFVTVLAAGIATKLTDHTSLIVAGLMFVNGGAVLVHGRKWKSAVRRIVTLSALGTATSWIVLWAGETFSASVLLAGLAAAVTAYAIPWYLTHRPHPENAAHADDQEAEPEPATFEAVDFAVVDFDQSFWQHVWTQAGFGGDVRAVQTESPRFRVLTVRMDHALTARDSDHIAEALRAGGARTVTLQQDPADPAIVYAHISGPGA